MKHIGKFKALPLSIAVASALCSTYTIAQDTSDEVEVIQVRGIKSSLNEAMSLKKDAASIQDSIVAEDIGKFPDQNVAESLQRISGVMIDRTNGEGSKITVRGMGPQFNAVKVNDRTLATTEKGREFDFQALPSELIAGADVVKAARANISEGSIGAYVNVNTARPLNNPGLHGAGSLKVKYNDLSNEKDLSFSGIVSNTFLDDSFGVLLGISSTKSNNRIDAASTTHWESFNANDRAADPNGDMRINPPINNNHSVQDIKGNAVTDGLIWTPGRAVYSLDEELRERFSSNLTMQWQQSTDVTHTFDLLYTDLNREAVSSGMQVPLQHKGWTDVVVSDNFTMLEGTKYGRPIDGLFQERGQDSNTIAAGFNSVIYHDRWEFEADVSYSKAEATPRQNTLVTHLVNPNYPDLAPTDPNYIDGQIKGLTANDFITLNNHGDIMNVDTSIDIADPASVRSHWNAVRSDELEDKVIEAKFDASYEIDDGIMQSVDMGIAYTDRTKSRNAFKPSQDCLNRELWDALPALPEFIPGTTLSAAANTIRPYNTCGQRADFDDNLFAINNSNFLSQESGNFPRNFVLVKDIEAYKDAVGEIRNEPNWDTEILNEGASVENTEENLALYTQLNLLGETNSFNWSGNVGLRYVKTETSSSGAGQEIDEVLFDTAGTEGDRFDITYTAPQVITESTSYNHLLPSLNVNLDFQNGFMIKTAAAKVITRPPIEDTGVNKNYPTGARAGSYVVRGGNPSLSPYEATQYDLAFELYEESGNAYSVSFFYKDITSFISNTQSEFSVPVTNYGDPGVTFENLVGKFEGKNNRSGGTVSGVEIAALHFFDYLPGWLSGFGVQANYTYTDSEDKNAANDLGNEKNFLENVVAADGGLEGFSENAYNLIAFYDKENFQARIAYNWRDSFLKHRSGPTVGSTGLPQHVDAYGQLDFSTSYDISETLTISAEAINLTDESVLEYADIRERVILKQYTGRRYQVGITAKF